MHFYIGKDGRQLGPFDGQQVREQLNSGAIGYDDLLWQEGMPAWAPVRTVFPPLGAPVMPPPGIATATPFAPPPGNPFVSAVTREEPPAAPQLADRGKRLLAVILDGLVMLFCIAPGAGWFVVKFNAASHAGGGPGLTPEELILQSAGPLLVVLLPLLVMLIVQTALLCKHGQTLGKRWTGIRIVRTDGSAAGFVHAILLRSFVMQMIGAIPLVGGLVSLVDPLLIFRDDRRCLHDLIADTVVIEA